MTNHELHIILWDELARSGSALKLSTRTVKAYRPINACFACVEAGLSHDTSDEPEEVYMARLRKHCRDHCPIDWGEPEDDITPCEASGTLYSQWWNCEDPKERKRLAALIRDLPWRKR